MLFHFSQLLGTHFPDEPDFLDQIEWMKIGTDIADYLLPLPDDLDLPR